MTSDAALIALVRQIVKATMDEAIAGARIPKVLAGSVEDLDETLDVAYVRMDQEAMGADPTQSDNWGDPGVIATTRLGETLTGEQVRVSFDGAAGASASRTSVENAIVLPFAAETGERIILDGNTGTIQFYDENDVLVGYLDATQWSIGVPGASLARLDPLSGLRLRDDTDALRVQLAPSEGLILSHTGTEGTGVILADDGLIVIDPASGDRISITSGTTSAVPTPHWVGSEATSPGASHTAPAVTSFGTGDDIDLRFVCASAPSDLGAQTYTPPAGYTERSDVAGSGSGITLATSSATLDPAVASPGVVTFTSTSAGWTRRNGQSVIVRGGGASSPAFRAAATTAVLQSSAASFGFDVTAPVGLADGDLMVAFVALASSQVPVGWTVPEGWKQLGVQVSGLGTTHVLSSGIWYKRAGASEPATYHVNVNMAAAGLTKIHTVAHAIQNPYGFPGGLDIRRNNRSMPRGLVASVEATADTGQKNDVALPFTDLTLSNVSLLAGRKYIISYECPIYLFNASANGICGFRIQRNSVDFHRSQLMLSNSELANAIRNTMILSREYVPPADETSTWRLVLTNESTSFNINLLGHANYRRTLRIEDIGAVF